MSKAQTIVGKWRFTAMSTWDRDYIDLFEPGYIAFAVRDMGEMAFGVVTATLDCAFDKTKCDVSFDFTGPAETMDRRADRRLAEPVPTPRQGLRVPQPQGPRVPAPGLHSG